MKKDVLSLITLLGLLLCIVFSGCNQGLVVGTYRAKSPVLGVQKHPKKYQERFTRTFLTENNQKPWYFLFSR